MKMKWMRWTSLLLVICMMLSMVACSKKPTIVGTWKGTINFGETLSDAFESGLGEDAENMKKYFDFNDMTIEMVLEFDKEDNCVMKFDEASSEEFAEDVINIFSEGMQSYMNEILEPLGYSADEYAKSQGKTWDEIIAENFDVNSMMEGMFQEYAMKYKLEGDKLYTYAPTDNYDEGECAYIQLDTEKMVWTAIENMGDEESVYGDLKNILPIEFVRQ